LNNGEGSLRSFGTMPITLSISLKYTASDESAVAVATINLGQFCNHPRHRDFPVSVFKFLTCREISNNADLGETSSLLDCPPHVFQISTHDFLVYVQYI
jgi:hypothetical protein